MITNNLGLLIVIAGALVLGGLMLWSHLNRNRLLKQRRDDSVETFVSEFADTAISRAVLEMAYDDLANGAKIAVRRADDLEKTLGFLPEVMSDVVEKRCQSLGLGDVWKLPHASMFPLKTSDDYVRFLSAVTEAQQKSGAKRS